ncbi:hypothetical protein TCDM_13319 [Trypanosoma cruzi Dm28c]|uniref:Uncharacterized protein n=1 Tax=Trypanosoma cruzi Dm28c TaxID=1416333 RepID=V5AIY8_TRYCR|nr:hypothetical protein TCDM_13319 [Trypanosoma cruzi Dm28c]
MPIVPYLWTRRIHVQRRRRNQSKLLAAQMAVKKWQRGCPPLIGAEDGGPSHSTTSHQSAQAAHRTADVPPDVLNCPTKSSRRAVEIIRQRRSTVVRRNTDVSPLGRLREEGERGGPRDVDAINVGAENVSSWAIYDLFAACTNSRSTRRAVRPFVGTVRRGAIDPTAARQDTAVYVANEWNPAGYGGFEVTKGCGAIGDEAGAPRDRGRDESSYPQSDRLQGKCCFSTCVDNGESLVWDCGLHSQQFHTGA